MTKGVINALLEDLREGIQEDLREGIMEGIQGRYPREVHHHSCTPPCTPPWIHPARYRTPAGYTPGLVHRLTQCVRAGPTGCPKEGGLPSESD